jgi:hypothetical protein
MQFLFYLAHELHRPIKEILDLSVVEIQAWQEWFAWRAEEEKRQIEQSRRRK